MVCEGVVEAIATGGPLEVGVVVGVVVIDVMFGDTGTIADCGRGLVTIAVGLCYNKWK